MNDDFTFLIFTYHNVFHSLLASFRLRKWRLLALVSSDVDVTCVLSFRSAFPTQRCWVMMKTNFQPKIGLKQPNVLTQRSQPSIWVEKITQRFLECMESMGYFQEKDEKQSIQQSRRAEGSIGCLHMTSLLWREMQLEGRKWFFSIGISSRNSRCLCFAMFMNAQIVQTEKTQGDFIVY